MLATQCRTRLLRALPNLLTLSRIPAGAALLLTAPFSPWFFALYLYCGLSDALDGWLARRTQSASATGAKLDSLADLVFAAAEISLCVRALPLAPWMLYGALAVALLRLVTLVIGFLKYRAFPLLHTYANKAAGALLFLLPFLYLLFGMRAAALLTCAVAGLSAFEEGYLTLTRDTLDRDVRGLLWRDRPCKRP